MITDLRVVADGFHFLEGPRWRDGRLWVSDMHGERVVTVTPDGVVEPIVEVPTQPSGLGWLPDGRLLVVSMTDRRLLRLEAGRLVVHADLSGLATFHCNDMVVDPAGRAYVGNFGYDYEAGQAFTSAVLALVHPDGRVEPAAARAAPSRIAWPQTVTSSRACWVASTGGRSSSSRRRPSRAPRREPSAAPGSWRRRSTCPGRAHLERGRPRTG